MRAAYRERLEAVAAAAKRFCHGALRLRAVQTGLHVVADLEEVEAIRVSREAATRGVEVAPLSAYFARPARAPEGLVLGFAVARPEAATRAMERVAAAIDAARRS
jgi:GntR family transcriptional regulator/MocR family aminotransferase